MKSRKFYVFSLLIVASLILAACQPAATPAPTPAAPAGEEPAPAAADTLSVVNILNGVQGDKSFFDSAVRGVTRAQSEFGIQVRTIEASYDPARWKPALEDAAANADYDLIVVGTNQMVEFVEEIAPRYPEKKFILYDDEVNYAACECSNVYSIVYKQNEGSYLAGLYAGLMSETGIVGAVGGQDIPVIQDFIVGYVQGAMDAGIPEENVIIQFAGNWDDPARGKEIALAMYQQGADIVFQIAGGTGMGVFQAAQEMGKYAIGVDSDQATIIAETNPEQARFIPTSMLKNVDNSLYRAISLHLDGQLEYGKTEALGVAEGGVGLAYNNFFDEATPQEVKDRLAQAEADLLAGNIIVRSVY
jgi:basic membrane protein A and related proteins